MPNRLGNEYNDISPEDEVLSFIFENKRPYELSEEAQESGLKTIINAVQGNDNLPKEAEEGLTLKEKLEQIANGIGDNPTEETLKEAALKAHEAMHEAFRNNQPTFTSKPDEKPPIK